MARKVNKTLKEKVSKAVQKKRNEHKRRHDVKTLSQAS